MDEHDVHSRVADVTTADEAHEDRDVAAHRYDEQHAVGDDGHDVAVVERHVYRQCGRSGIEEHCRRFYRADVHFIDDAVLWA